ncbi:MAG: hybrid sensor histidine kinase/response regulator [Desulfococcaceae bacterium]|jgi:two-component system sensor histidine kinase and response regulator WspE|nr:hybrid sensor histidine kinase/response regulator [Desulfococcaceae bacterium]
MNSPDIHNNSMLDLFRSEVETHAAAMSNSLLALENDPESLSHIEELMRAAHSIKGGARIVEMDDAVQLAHTMEDCFVSVRKEKKQLRSDHIDILLQGVDLLVQLAVSAESEDRKNLQPITARLCRAIGHILQQEAESRDGKEAQTESPRVSLEKTQEGTEGGTFLKKNEPAAPPPPASPVPGISLSCAPEGQSPVPDDSLSFAPEGQSPVPNDSLSLSPEEQAKSPSARTDRREAEKTGTETETAKPAPRAEAPRTDSAAEEGREKSPEPEQPPPAGPGTDASDRSGAAPPGKNTGMGNESGSRTGGPERTVRVTAGKIERLMGLAGEVVVSARWLPPFTDSLLMLKRNQGEISLVLDELLKELNRLKEGGQIPDIIQQLRDKIKSSGLDLADRINDIDMFTNVSAALADRLYHEVVGVRMCPFSEGIGKYPRIIRDLARKLGKKARLQISGESTEVDRDILEKLDAPLYHLLCNAVAHGIESPEKRKTAGKSDTGTVHLEAAHRAGMLMIIISDDGRGIEPEELRRKIIEKGKARPDIAQHLSVPELMDFLFLPGFTTREDVNEISGRGVGLDVVHSTVHEVGGVIRVTTDPGKGLSFHMELPLTLSVIRTFLVEIAGEPYAFPLARIDRCLKLEKEDIRVVEDRQYFRFDDSNIALVDIREVLEMEVSEIRREQMNVVVVSDRVHAYGMVVDNFLGECDLVVRPLDSRLGKIPDISAAAVMMDGSPVLIFDVEDMVHSIGSLLSGKSRLNRVDSGTESKGEKVPKRILVVEDSFIVREKERKLLETKGYEVDVAVDGQDGWNCLRTADYDMVVTDIDMPRMNGFELIRNIRQHSDLRSLPVVVVSYKASEDDRLQGLKAGANYYLTKTDFDDNSLINAVIDLIGEA